MKLVRRISLFLVISVVMLGIGGYTTLKAEQFFYPNRYQPTERVKQEKQENKKSETAEIQIIEAAVEDKSVVTADTRYLIEEIDLTRGSVNEREENIPVKYIGLDREEMLEELKAYDNNPPLTELERGFQTIELTAFSKDHVVVCKYYKEKEDKGFYLMVADHFIVVYEQDKKTLYMNTDILLENLEVDLQAEIMKGKYIESEEELYHFLESYSS